jgi:hypothetical protein
MHKKSMGGATLKIPNKDSDSESDSTQTNEHLGEKPTDGHKSHSKENKRAIHGIENSEDKTSAERWNQSLNKSTSHDAIDPSTSQAWTIFMGVQRGSRD